MKHLFKNEILHLLGGGTIKGLNIGSFMFFLDCLSEKSIGKKVVTTKKDYYKIIAIESIKNIYCIDISIKFLAGKDDFNYEIGKVLR